MKKTGFYVFLFILGLVLFFIAFAVLVALDLKDFCGWSLAMLCGSVVMFIKPLLQSTIYNEKRENPDPIAFLLLAMGIIGMAINYFVWITNERITQNLINGYY